MTYTVKPLTDFTIFTTPSGARKGVQFKAEWWQTEAQLQRELDYLDATDAVLEIAVQPHHVKVNGELRANVPKDLPHPGVRLSFKSKHGDLSYSCDTYAARYYGQMADWQANLRAIVLTLEALRAVDRYGATKGEQYAGFKELTATPSGMSGDAARAMIATLSGYRHEATIPWGTDDWKAAYRRARANAHPDRNGGEREKWDQVEAAGRALGLA